MTTNFLDINGMNGGGQILRAALALSSASGIAFHMHGIRGKREKPGLKRQHLMCVKACAEICGANVEGAELNSNELTYIPHAVRPGDYRFDIGTGGSTVLLMQAVVPALASALGEGEKASVTVTGGTYCVYAPPFEFLNETLAPAMNRMGYSLRFTMPRPGFYHAGGGMVRMEAEGPFRAKPFAWEERGGILSADARILNCNLNPSIADRERLQLIRSLGGSLPLEEDSIAAEALPEILEPGNAVLLRLICESGTSIFSEIGRPGMSAETVARVVAEQALSFAASGTAVCRNLADQLLVPLALAGGGRFLTTLPSKHTKDCAQVVQAFTGKPVTMNKTEKGWEVTVPALERKND